MIQRIKTYLHMLKLPETALVAMVITAAYVFSLLSTAAISAAAAPLPEIVELGELKNFYESVLFDHALHSESYDCVACHHISETGVSSTVDSTAIECSVCHQNNPEAESERGPRIAACRSCHLQQTVMVKTNLPVDEAVIRTDNYHIDTPMLLGAYHLQCLGCHRMEGAPSGCQDCHLLTERGQKQFQVRDK